MKRFWNFLWLPSPIFSEPVFEASEKIREVFLLWVVFELLETVSGHFLKVFSSVLVTKRGWEAIGRGVRFDSIQSIDKSKGDLPRAWKLEVVFILWFCVRRYEVVKYVLKLVALLILAVERRDLCLNHCFSRGYSFDNVRDHADCVHDLCGPIIYRVSFAWLLLITCCQVTVYCGASEHVTLVRCCITFCHQCLPIIRWAICSLFVSKTGCFAVFRQLKVILSTSIDCNLSIWFRFG